MASTDSHLSALEPLVAALLSTSKDWTYEQTVRLWDLTQPLGKEIEARLRLAHARYLAATEAPDAQH